MQSDRTVLTGRTHEWDGAGRRLAEHTCFLRDFGLEWELAGVFSTKFSRALLHAHCGTGIAMSQWTRALRQLRH